MRDFWSIVQQVVSSTFGPQLVLRAIRKPSFPFPSAPLIAQRRAYSAGRIDTRYRASYDNPLLVPTVEKLGTRRKVIGTIDSFKFLSLGGGGSIFSSS